MKRKKQEEKEITKKRKEEEKLKKKDLKSKTRKINDFVVNSDDEDVDFQYKSDTDEEPMKISENTRTNRKRKYIDYSKLERGKGKRFKS